MKDLNKFIIERLKLDRSTKSAYSYDKLERFINKGNTKWGNPITDEHDGFALEAYKIYYFETSHLRHEYAYIYVLGIDYDTSNDSHRDYEALVIRRGSYVKEKINITYCKFDSDCTIHEIWINICNTNPYEEWPNVEFNIADEDFLKEFSKMVNALYDATNMERYDIIKDFNDLCLREKLITCHSTIK